MKLSYTNTNSRIGLRIPICDMEEGEISKATWSHADRNGKYFKRISYDLYSFNFTDKSWSLFGSNTFKRVVPDKSPVEIIYETEIQ